MIIFLCEMYDMKIKNYLKNNAFYIRNILAGGTENAHLLKYRLQAYAIY